MKEYLADFQRRELPPLTPRDLSVSGSKKVVSVIGPRRAGKTFFLYQKMRERVESGVKKSDIVYLNFEDPRLAGVTFREVRDIIKIQWELFPPAGNTHIFIDEPQNVEGWEMAVRALHDEGFMVFLTGSSSKLLSKEVSTSLRGRTLPYVLLPFSFREALHMKGVSATALGSREKSALLNALGEYLDNGGFPEVVREEDAETRVRILEEYLNMVVYRDIVERYRIRNTQLVRWLIKSLTASFAKEFSTHKLYATLKSQGMKVSKNSLYAYVAMFEDSMFIFTLPKFSPSVRKGDFSIRKAYLADTGFARALAVSGNTGRKMENVVFLELLRRKQPLGELCYWKGLLGKEVDFVVKDGRVTQLVQVCADIRDSAVRKREVGALLEASRELRCANLLVITSDYEARETKEGRTITYTPLWKWLLA